MPNPDMVPPKRLPIDYVPEDLMQVAQEIGRGTTLSPGGAILEPNLSYRPETDSPVLKVSSDYLPEMRQEDLEDFFTLYKENIDTILEKIESLKDKYFEALQLQEQLDLHFEDLVGNERAVAKGKLAEYKDEIKYYEDIFALIKRYAYGTPFDEQIPG